MQELKIGQRQAVSISLASWVDSLAYDLLATDMASGQLPRALYMKIVGTQSATSLIRSQFQRNGPGTWLSTLGMSILSAVFGLLKILMADSISTGKST